MKALFNVIKLFFLDWLITIVMYSLGYLIAGLGVITGTNKTTIVKYLNLVIESKPGLVDVYTYLFISFSLVILISFLINKKSLKAPIFTFFISQVAYIISVALIARILL